MYDEQAGGVTPLTKRQRIMQRKSALWTERSSWITHWQEISDYILPSAGRYFVTDRNKGTNRNQNIYDNTGIRALRVLAAGMMAGMTSPARPWFRLAISDKDLMEAGPVKVWLNKTTIVMRDVFNRSNTYRALHSGYEELGAFGTAATMVLPDFDNVIHHYPLTAGEYALATDDKGVVNTLCREYQMTVGQLVGKFGRDKVSQTVRNMYDRHALEQWVTVVQMVEPRKDRDPKLKDAKNMAFSSCYLEAGNDNQDQMLRESGFKRFPVLASRWAVSGGDIYGRGPGREALGDIKQLQHEQLRKSQGIDYMTNPPIVVPSAMKDHARARLPGGVFYDDNVGAGKGVRSAFEVNLRLDHLLEDIADVRNRINAAFYADLFLMLSQMDKSGVTATEVAERHEEKLLMLGPVLERLHNELLNPLIDVTFDYVMEAGILPPPPPELQDMDLNVEFISTLAQAQRAIGAGSLDRMIGTVGTIAGLKPDIVDKFDFDQAVDDYADVFGINPELIVPDEVVAEKRAAAAQAAAQAQAAAAMPTAVDAAKTASEINTPGLTDVMNSVMGYSTPAAA